ncbi:MAG: efflux RND transporter periplasmic adaptor subunit [Candidatus Binataceae bacterium]
MISAVKSAAMAVLTAAILAFAGCGSPEPSRASAPNPVITPMMIHQGGTGLLRLNAAAISGMTIVPVRQVELPGVLETTGQVTFDQKNVAQIVSRVAGRIEATRAVLWDYVRRGEPIVQLYSPDFMTAEAEYVQALTTRGVIPKAQDQYAAAMVSAARRKLELLGMSKAEISALKGPSPTVWMRAPISGTVVKNSANIGSAVNPGDVLYTLGTLNDVWITADIYENDLSRIHPGQQLEATTTAWPNEVFRGVISRISPDIDPATHTLKIRCEIHNPRGRLRPEMLARIRIVTHPGEALVVPQDALVFEGDAYYVFVRRGRGLFERRQVEIAGWHEQGYARVLHGLAPGENVVASESIQINSLWHEANGTY